MSGFKSDKSVYPDAALASTPGRLVWTSRLHLVNYKDQVVSLFGSGILYAEDKKYAG
ncbi:hypothetical protein ES703_71962 [subsurface metagenome]